MQRKRDKPLFYRLQVDLPLDQKDMVHALAASEDKTIAVYMRDVIDREAADKLPHLIQRRA